MGQQGEYAEPSTRLRHLWHFDQSSEKQPKQSSSTAPNMDLRLEHEARVVLVLTENEANSGGDSKNLTSRHGDNQRRARATEVRAAVAASKAFNCNGLQK
jgi:hypothetical protein